MLRSVWLLLLAGHSLGVVAVAAHPAGTIAASTSLDSFVRVFDIDTNATVATLETPPSEAWLMQFDPKVCLLICHVLSSHVHNSVICTVVIIWNHACRASYLYPLLHTTHCASLLTFGL